MHLPAGTGAATVGGSAGPVQVGVVKVTDQRLSVLGEMYNPRKVVYAEIKFWDLPPADRANRNQGLAGRHRNILQGVGALLLVVRAFEDDLQGPADPARDLSSMLNELALADLETLERAEARLSDSLKKSKPAERPALVPQAEAVQKVRQELEAGKRVRQQDLTPSERSAIRDYQLLTDKSIVVAFNTDESGESASLHETGLPGEMMEGLGTINLCARLEEDLGLMPEDEAEEFRDALGLGGVGRGACQAGVLRNGRVGLIP